MKTGRGWWALAGFGALTAMGLYVSAYYATVLPHVNWGGDVVAVYRVPYWHSSAWYFFRPLNLLDRRLRPAAWQWKPAPGYGKP